MPGFAIDRMCAGAMTAVTTTASGIAAGAYDVAIAGGVEHMGHHPMGEGADPNPRFVADRLVDPSALNMGNTAENLHDRYPHLTKERADAYAAASQDKYAAALAAGNIDARPGPGRHPLGRAGLGPGHHRRVGPPRHHRRTRWTPCARRSARTAGSPPATPPR